MKWVTWKKVGVDRIGCAWLIQRLIDPEAEFVFIGMGDRLPIVVIDTYEHAFYIDYQNRKAEYIEKFMSHIDWQEAERRFQ